MSDDEQNTNGISKKAYKHDLRALQIELVVTIEEPPVDQTRGKVKLGLVLKVLNITVGVLNN